MAHGLFCLVTTSEGCSRQRRVWERRPWEERDRAAGGRGVAARARPLKKRGRKQGKRGALASGQNLQYIFFKLHLHNITLQYASA